ncbi:LCP family protein [Ornithinimicrobium sp. W1679]|uniref:LCP family protein n=1 Tax=Ornithinimicrobium sp. W1679 TaxID=3418770 RepID=UPI003CF58605
MNESRDADRASRARSGGEHAAHVTRAEHRRRRPRQGLGRALGLTALSAVVPGAGLLPTRRRGLGLVLVALAVAALVAVGWWVSREGLTSTALQTAADGGRLRTIIGILVAGTLVWIGSISLTALMTQPRRSSTGQRVALASFTGLLCLVVSAPAVMGVRYIDSHLDAMDKVFTDGTVGGGDADDGAVATSSLRPGEDPWVDLPRVNMLLLGSDAAEAREGTRTDTMIVASIDTRTGDAVLFSVPRNLQQVPFPRDHPLHEVYPDGYDCGDQCLMNAVWMEAERHAEEEPGLYAGDPNVGLTATRRTLETVLGVPIHHTVIVNLEGFEDLIDAMGGVTITVKEEIPINGRTFTDANGKLQLDPNSPQLEWLQPGTQRLNGFQALGYSRSRVLSDDFDRMRRQRCMVAAVIDQANPMTLLQRYPAIITAVGDNVVTDIPRQDLGAWAELTLLVQDGTLKSLPFTAQNTDTADPNYSNIRYRVWEALHPAPEPEPTEEPAPAVPTEDVDGATPTGATEDAPTTSPVDDGSATTTEPADELEEIGTVCD